MADYNLGTARGKIEIDSSGVTTGMAAGSAASKKMSGDSAAAAATFGSSGKAIGLAGLAIVGGLGYAVKTAADFEERISGIAAVSGATGKEVDALRGLALKLGADTKYSAGEAAQAMEELVKAGLTVPDVLNGAAEATVNLAAAGEVDLPRAAEIAATAMSVFSLKAQDMPKVADLIAGAANASAISVEDFAQSMTQGGAVAKLVGMSFEDTATAITLLGKEGLKGSDAGTSLKTMLQNLQPQTDKQTEAFKNLNLLTKDGTSAFFDQEGHIKSLAQVSQLLKDGTSGMTDEQKSLNLEMAFGTDAIRAAADMAKYGADGVNELSDAMSKVTAADVAAKRMDNLKGSLEQLKGSAETLLIIVGESFQGPMKAMADAITGVVNKLSEMDPATLATIAKIVSLVGSVLVAAGGILYMVSVIMKMKQSFDILSNALKANPWVLVVAGLVILGTALYSAYKNFEGFRNVVDKLFDVIQNAVAPVIDTVTRFVKNAVDQFKNLFDMFSSGGADAQGFAEIMDNILGNTGNLIPFFKSLYDVVSNVFTWIKDNVVPVIQNVVDAVGGWGNVLKIIGVVIAAVVAPWATLVAALIYAYTHFEIFRTIVQIVIDVVMAVIKTMIDFFVVAFHVAVAVVKEAADIIQNVWGKVNTAFDAAVVVLKAVGRWFAWLGKEIMERLSSAFDWMNAHVFPTFYAFGELVAAVVGAVINVLQTIGTVIKFIAGIVMSQVNLIITIWKMLWPAFEFVGNLLKTVLLPIFQFVFNMIKAAFQIFVDVVTGIWRAFGDNIWNFIKMIWDFIVGIIGAALDVIRGIIQVVTGIISGDWGKIWEGIKTVFSGIWDAIQAIVKVAIESVKNAIDAVLSTIRLIWDTAWSTIKNVLSAVWDTMKSTVSGAITGVIQFFRDLPGNIINAIGNMAGFLAGKGRDIVQGLLDGARAIGGLLHNFFAELPGNILRVLGNMGSLLYNIGGDIIRGLLNGIKSGFNAVKDFVGGIGDTITSLKGPPSYDKVMLVENGQLIMKGLITGMEGVMPDLRSSLRSMTAGIPAMASAGGIGGASGGGVVVNMNFNGEFGAGSEDAIRSTLQEPSLMRNIISAAKAGAGGGRS